MTDEMGKSKGFGFVSFEEPENAEKVSFSSEGIFVRRLCIYNKSVFRKRWVYYSLHLILFLRLTFYLFPTIFFQSILLN